MRLAPLLAGGGADPPMAVVATCKPFPHVQVSRRNTTSSVVDLGGGLAVADGTDLADGVLFEKWLSDTGVGLGLLSASLGDAAEGGLTLQR